MFKVILPSGDDFYCLCDLTGLTLGQSLIITNNTNSQIRINRTAVKPDDPLLGFPVWPGQTILVHGNEEQPVWTRGNTNGYILVQPLTETMMPLTGVELPQDIVTSGVSFSA